MKLRISFRNTKAICLLCIQLSFVFLFANAQFEKQKVCDYTLTLDEEDSSGITFKNDEYFSESDSPCYRLIQTHPDYGIRLDIVKFRLDSRNCSRSSSNSASINGDSQESKKCCNYLNIGSGPTVNRELKHHLCSSQWLEPILFQTNNVWLNLYDYQAPFVEFEINIAPFRLVYRNESDLISSPTYNDTKLEYMNNMNVTYSIIGEANSFFIFRFQKHFGIEKALNKCYDYLEIGSIDQDRTSTNYIEPVRFCGHEFPPQFHMKTNQVYLRFVSDNNLTNDGFELYYKRIKYLHTEPSGLISLTNYPINITYEIRAPADQKIELIVESFEFPECYVKETAQMISSPMTACSLLNDHLMFINEKGNFTNDILTQMENVNGSLAWTFCACNRPVSTYISLTNEIKIKYFVAEKNTRNVNDFIIFYKFIPGVFRANNQLRIVQDEKTSFINGYNLNIIVPFGNHLRLYGKSAKCEFPSKSFYVKKPRVQEFNTKSELVQMSANNQEFKQKCSYLFDVSEPMFVGEMNRTEWEFTWFIQFENSHKLYDFELNWMFLKNDFLNEKKNGVIELPKQMGFESKWDDLEFRFKSLSDKKFTLFFESEPKVNEKNDLVRLKFSSFESIVTSKYLNDKTNGLPINLAEAVLRVKRANELALNVSYVLETQTGDCDFDISMCNYTLNASQSLLVQHKPKYTILNGNELNVMSKVRDFYLSVSKLNEKSTGTVYSPMVTVQNKPTPFNTKVLQLSFSYGMSEHDGNNIGLILIQNRSDSVLKLENRMFLSDYKLKSESVSQIEISNVCPSVSPSSFLNSIVLNEKHKREDDSLISLQNQLNSKVTLDTSIPFKWFRAKKIRFFTCYDFRFGFEFNLDNTTTSERKTNSLDVSPSIGLDDIEINYESSVSECEESVCGSNGKCYTYDDKQVCCCNPGFEGDRCEIQISACKLKESMNKAEGLLPDVCKNGGECADLLNTFDYKCQCKPGYTGKNCETEINECLTNPCKNQAQCIDMIGGYECICKNGFSGLNCERENKRCEETCEMSGTEQCFNDRSNVVCKCKPNFTGHRCEFQSELLANKCKLNPCLKGECVIENDDIKCICPEHRTGKYCEIFLNFCQNHENLCLNGSHCLYANEDASKFKCSCDSGFTGKFCNETINYCDQSPCKNGQCANELLSYKCTCNKGYTGRNCDVKMNNPCYQHKCVKGTCRPDDSLGYRCECFPEAKGDFCEIEKCNKEEYFNSTCDQNGTIEVISNSGQCVCKCRPGFVGARCETRENLCEQRLKNGDLESECLNGGTCVYNSTLNQVSCVCPKQFEGDRCQLRKDKCANNPCKYGVCTNKIDSFECACVEGWGGQQCDQPINMCNNTLGEFCHKENTENILVSPPKRSLTSTKCVCLCKLGFTGERCDINIDDCKANPCQNDAICIDHVASYECKCPLGYDGPNCEKKVMKCALNPCNNGTCEETGGKINCTCDRGYTGEFCDQLIDKCKPNPCENGGICHNLIDDFYCACPVEYRTSKRCEVKLVDPCQSGPCLNNGTCTALPESSGATVIYKDYICRCPESFTGKYCETKSNNIQCPTNPCKNGGICNLDKGGMPKCKCPTVFGGVYCDQPIYLKDICEGSTICNNGGTCLNTPNGAQCRCPPNYGGMNCNRKFEPCDYMMCKNGGVCLTDANNSPYCKCSEKFVGTRCEIDLINLLAVPSQLSNDKAAKCDVLGNQVTTIDYIFALLIIFVVLLLIIALVYIYVHFGIKRSKKAYERILAEEEKILVEFNQNNNRFA